MIFEGSKYVSNGGKGPLIAECISIEGVGKTAIALMVRWNRRGGRKTCFRLPVSFFNKRTCGWVCLDELGGDR